MNGKSDPIDAYAAAKTALTEAKQPTPKTGDGNAEQIRYLFTARRSAIKARTAAQVQLKSLLVTAPTSLRERFRNVTDATLITTLADFDIRPYPEHQGVVIGKAGFYRSPSLSPTSILGTPDRRRGCAR